MAHGSEAPCTIIFESTSCIRRKPGFDINKSTLPLSNYGLNLLSYNIYTKVSQDFVKVSGHRVATSLEMGFDTVSQNREGSLSFQTAGFPERQNPFHPPIAFFTLGPQAAFSP
jgi:hypothetical protein